MPRLFEIPQYSGVPHCGTMIDLDKVESVSNLKHVHPDLLCSDTVLAYDIGMVSGKIYCIQEMAEFMPREEFLKIWEGNE